MRGTAGIAAALICVLLGCTEGTSGVGTTTGGTGGDAGAGGNEGSGDGGPIVQDAFRLPDFRERGDGSFGSGAFRDDCEDNRDCLSGFCVPFEDHNVCTERCLDEGCPDGWSCHGVANTDPDVVFICFPPGNRLCGVCLSDSDCPGGHCYTLDGQNICGLDCATDETCPKDYECKAVLEGADAPKQCVARTGSCTCNVSRDQNERVCEPSP